MKLKKNQVMITALAIMIAIAGYLNFAGNQMKEETLVVTDEVVSDEEMAALLDLSEEDILSDIDNGEDVAMDSSVEDDEVAITEIESLDEDAVLTSNYILDSEEEVVVDMSSNEEEAMEDIITRSFIVFLLMLQELSF